MMGRLIVFGSAVLLVAQVAAAQSLADVARKEAERRKAVTQPSKVYTNEDLRRLPPATGQSQPAEGQKPADAAPAAVPATDASPAPAKAKPAAEAPSREPAKDEAYWRKRITDARADLERIGLLIGAFESRVNALTADFSARDDPAQRAVIARDRQKALAELERLKKDREAQEKAIKGIEEEARQAGVPPGWLR
jgi:hypothetical protein